MRFKRFLSKHSLTVYLVSNFLLTWIFWLLIYLSSIKMANPVFQTGRMNILGNSLSTFIFIGGSMPSVLAVVFTWITEGRKGLKSLLSRLILWKVNPFWYFFALLFCFAVTYLPYILCNLSGTNYTLLFRPSILTPIQFLAAIVFWGPLGEEIGWRGYVLPRLQAKLHPVMSGIVLGAVWGLWHLPLFFITGTNQFGTSFISFMVADVALSIVFTWVYNHTKGSLLLACLFHAAWNFTGTLFSVYQTSADSTAYLIVSNVIYVAILTAVIINMFHGKKTLPANTLTNE